MFGIAARGALRLGIRELKHLSTDVCPYTKVPSLLHNACANPIPAANVKNDPLCIRSCRLVSAIFFA
jgi:hypothetical protein